MDHYFSPSTGGFYNEATHGMRMIAEPLTEKQIKAGRTAKYRANPACLIPPDAMLLTADDWQRLLAAQGEGKVIAVRVGRVVAIDPPPPPVEEQLAAIRARRDRLLAATDVMLTVPDYPISAEQREELTAWRALLRDLPDTAVTAGGVVTVEWPAAPAWLAEKGVQL